MSKLAFGLAKATFDVSLFKYSSIHSWLRSYMKFLKEQRKYDEMVSDLANGVNRILSFAVRTAGDVLYDEGDLLAKAIGKLYELIVESATFICSYTKRNIAGEYDTLDWQFFDDLIPK